jgi:hypothetical protein
VQPFQAFGERLRVVWRHQVAGLAVDHCVPDAADIGTDHRPAAGHRFQRCDAEGLVPGRGDEYVGGAVVVAQGLALAPAGEQRPVGHAFLFGDRPQTRDFGRVARVGVGVFAADDEQTRVDAVLPLQHPDGADHVVDALARHQPAELKHDEFVCRQTEPFARAAVARPQFARIDAARDDHDAFAVGAVQAGQIGKVLRALGDDAVGTIDQRVLDRDPFVRKSVGAALVQSADATERVEGDDQRHLQSVAQEEADLSRHEKVRVHDVVAPWPLFAPAGDPRREGRHMGKQSLLRHRLWGPGVDLDDARARRQHRHRRGGGVVAPCEHVDPVTQCGQLAGDEGDIDVLSPAVDAALRGKG